MEVGIDGKTCAEREREIENRIWSALSQTSQLSSPPSSSLQCVKCTMPPSLLPPIPPPFKQHQQVFLRLSADVSKFVRQAALQQLGPFLATLQAR